MDHVRVMLDYELMLLDLKMLKAINIAQITALHITPPPSLARRYTEEANI